MAVAPNNATAHNELGAALLELGRIDESLHEFEVALTIDPDHVLACTNLALVLAARGGTEEAIRLYQRVLDLEPGNADARRELDRLRRGAVAPRLSASRGVLAPGRQSRLRLLVLSPLAAT